MASHPPEWLPYGLDEAQRWIDTLDQEADSCRDKAIRLSMMQGTAPQTASSLAIIADVILASYLRREAAEVRASIAK